MSPAYGGIVGGNHARIYSCYNCGKISGSIKVGGITGCNFDRNANVEFCYNTGEIIGDQKVGGIIGINGYESNTGGNVKNCYNIGITISENNIEGNYIGSIIGYNRLGGIIENCYWLNNEIKIIGNDEGNEAIESYSKTADEMKSKEFVEQLNKGTYVYDFDKENKNSGFPILDFDAPKIAIKYSEKTNNKITVTINSDEEIKNISGWTISNDKKTLTKTFYLNKTSEIIVEDYNYNIETATININNLSDSILLTGDYNINNLDDFLLFVQEVNNGNSFEGRNIYLNNDIILDKDTNFEIIGSEENKFKGNFFGNNHKISRIYIENYSDYKGLFAYVENTRICDLIIDGSITGNAIYIGTIVAYSDKSTVENCISNVKIESYRDDNAVNNYTWTTPVVGGIIGSLRNSTCNKGINKGNIYCTIRGSSGMVGGICGNCTSSTISRSSNIGNIETKGVNYSGGVVGYIYDIDSNVNLCSNNGNIKLNSIPQGAGGIGGGINVGTIENCYNTGEIEYTGTETTNGTASIYSIGGIIGTIYDSQKIKNCYNIGKTNTGGGIAGSIDKNTIVTNNYYLENMSKNGYNSSAIEQNEIISKSSNEMKQKQFVNELNWDTDVWEYDEYNINNGYPINSSEEAIILDVNTYTVENSIIKNIQPSTSYNDFINNITSNKEIIVKEGNTTVTGTTRIKTGQVLTVGSETYTLVVTGDTNGDGQANVQDILQINKHRLNKAQLTSVYFTAGDINKDGKVDIRDIMQLNKYRLGKIKQL